MVLDTRWTLRAGPALEFMGKAQKRKLSALGDRANYMSPFKAGGGPWEEDATQANRPFPFQMTRILFSSHHCLAFWAWACRLPPCCWGGHMARGLGWLDMVTSSQQALPRTSPQLNCHGGLKGSKRIPKAWSSHCSARLHRPIAKADYIWKKKSVKNHCLRWSPFSG